MDKWPIFWNETRDLIIGGIISIILAYLSARMTIRKMNEEHALNKDLNDAAILDTEASTKLKTVSVIEKMDVIIETQMERIEQLKKQNILLARSNQDQERIIREQDRKIIKLQARIKTLEDKIDVLENGNC